MNILIAILVGIGVTALLLVVTVLLSILSVKKPKITLGICLGALALIFAYAYYISY